jgi:hypothetical protein
VTTVCFISLTGSWSFSVFRATFPNLILAGKLESAEMHSQKRGLLRPHSAGGSWLGGPLPIFVMLALLIVGMYFFYSYNTQSNELELLRQKLDLLSRNYRKLQSEENGQQRKYCSLIESKEFIIPLLSRLNIGNPCLP